MSTSTTTQLRFLSGLEDQFYPNSMEAKLLAQADKHLRDSLRSTAHRSEAYGFMSALEAIAPHNDGVNIILKEFRHAFALI